MWEPVSIWIPIIIQIMYRRSYSSKIYLFVCLICNASYGRKIWTFRLKCIPKLYNNFFSLMRNCNIQFFMSFYNVYGLKSGMGTTCKRENITVNFLCHFCYSIHSINRFCINHKSYHLRVFI